LLGFLQDPLFLPLLRREMDADLGCMDSSERHLAPAMGLYHPQGFAQAILQMPPAAGGTGPFCGRDHPGAVRGHISG